MLGCTLTLPAAHAENESIHQFGGSATLISDYLFRGYSQTDEDPAIQGEFTYEHTPSGFYLGTWASNVEFNTTDNDDDSSIEIDVYAGFSGEFIENFSWDIGGLYYYYPDQNEDSGADYDYFEVYGGLGYTFADTTLQPAVGVMFSYSNDYFGEDGDSLYSEASLDLALPWEVGLGLHAGYIDVQGDRTSTGYNYTHWSVTLSKELGGFDLAVAYHDANHGGDDEACPDEVCQAVVFSVSRGF